VLYRQCSVSGKSRRPRTLYVPFGPGSHSSWASRPTELSSSHFGEHESRGKRSPPQTVSLLCSRATGDGESQAGRRSPCFMIPAPRFIVKLFDRGQRWSNLNCCACHVVPAAQRVTRVEKLSLKHENYIIQCLKHALKLEQLSFFSRELTVITVFSCSDHFMPCAPPPWSDQT
jgi:hypothetical protein